MSPKTSEAAHWEAFLVVPCVPELPLRYSTIFPPGNTTGTFCEISLLKEKGSCGYLSIGTEPASGTRSGTEMIVPGRKSPFHDSNTSKLASSERGVTTTIFVACQ